MIDDRDGWQEREPQNSVLSAQLDDDMLRQLVYDKEKSYLSKFL